MASKRREVSRRDFASQSIRAAAGIAVAGKILSQGRALAAAGPTARILGANDRVVLASIGIRGQGNALKRGFARLPNVEIKTLCDVDENLFAERAADTKLRDLPTLPSRLSAGPAARLRRQGRRRGDDRDAQPLARPGRDLGDAGGQARLRREAVLPHRVGGAEDGRGGPQVRPRGPGGDHESQPAGGAPGDPVSSTRAVSARSTWRAASASSRGPPSASTRTGRCSRGETYRLNVESSANEPAYDSAYLAKVNYDLWLGPAPQRPFNRNRFHYNWHWHWDYGDGDTGNQGPHQFDVARWGLRKNEHPVKIRSTGGYFGEASSQETPNLQTTAFEYADGKILEFATRGAYTNDEGTQKIGNLFYGTKGWVWIDGDGRKWQSYLGRGDEKGPGADASARAGRQRPAGPHEHRVGPLPELRGRAQGRGPGPLNCDILEGHLSSSLPHLANISYRVGRGLVFDGKTETFVGDPDADRLLTREYRAPFVVPSAV